MKLKELKVENGNKKTHLDNFNYLLDASDSVMAPDLDKGTLLERSHLLQGDTDQTRFNKIKLRKVQEDLARGEYSVIRRKCSNI
ncbi:CFC_HP_G0068240.mRNA.1.CDS.1 [Saccharomyces cerevisiae]|nr:CFC_HP_G0068240.mRNA.1.CDS.1 [Saccharomyces cerevisiae]CAI6647766.1 CFC_HP_G0068240.mRNA.1.CDS.1 [Saccharomyces cerevisiae]